MTLSIIAQMAVSGALMGLVYALIAYGFQLTYATSKSINFGQGELVMVSAFFSLTLITLGLPYEALHFFDSDSGEAVLHGSDLLRA